MEDVLGDDQDLQAVLGHGDFGGFDNDAIDFRNLEDYINGDDDNTMYFPESLVGNEVKSNETPNVTNGSGGLGGSKNTGHQQHQASQLLYGVLPPTNSAITYKNNLMNSGYSGHMHNLPESPPDSGSEPPYSPPDEDQKLHPIPPVHLSVSMNNNRKQPPLTQTQPLLSYSNTQPLKHMPDGSSVMGLGPQSHVPLIQQHPNLGVPSTPSGHPPPLPPPHHQQQHQPPPHLLHHNHMNQPQVNPLLPIPQGQSLDVVVNSPMGTPNLFNSLVRAPPYPTNKKRKHSESPNSNLSSNSNGDLINGIVHIKQEPIIAGGSPNGNGLAMPPANEIQRQHCSSPDHGSNHSGNGQLLDDDMSFDFNGDSNMAFVDSSYQCIRFQSFQQTAWHVVCDANLKELPVPNYRVDADKGFNFSNADDAFVCQKKNHFQVTVHAQLAGDPHYVRTPEGLKKIDSFYIHFYGVKVESPSQSIKVEQSQSDRSKKPFHPVHVELGNDQMVKITVGRLHFSETTSNNMRKKGKPNPDQRYFYLVVGLHAHCGENNYPLVSSASERIIVRASNPGQFESEVELSWQKGLTADSIYHSGRVGVNTERPDESLVVHGNIKITGHIVQPSDLRAKEDIQELDTKEQLRNLQQLRIVRYQYREDFAKHAGLHKDERQDTGIIAQEVQKVIPDAVKESGDIVLPSGQRIDNFLVVNKERIFMENIGAVKELCKVTDNLENRIDELERMNSKLAKLKRIDSLKSTSSGSTVSSLPSSSSIKKPLRRSGARRGAAKEGLCSNKFVQGTIIVLILVMAMCLIAMATLYILEWQKRQIYDVPATTTTSPNHSTSLSNNSVPNGNYTSGSPTSLGVLQVTPPSVRTKTSTVIHATSSSYTVRVLGKRDPIGVPSNCVGNKTQTENCHSFCCSDLPSVDGQSRPTSSPVLRHRSSSTKIVATPTSTITTPTTTGQQWHEVAIPRMISSDDVTRVSSVVITPSSFQRAQPNSNILYEQQRGTIRSYEVEHSTEDTYPSEIGGNKYPDDNDAVPWVNRPNKGVNFVKIKNANNDKPSRQKRSLPNKDAGLATIVQSIRLIEFNHTISEEYCSNCREGNFTYRIPISKYMPQQPLTLEFTLNNGSGIFVDYCQTGNKITECSLMLNQGSNDSTLSIGPTNERKTEETTPAWVLPIGNFVESSYKFRITKIQTHLDTCTAPSDRANINFVEYNFVFYRSCSD